jgi:hypothetical protein
VKVVLLSGQQDDATGTVRINDPPIVSLRDDHSDTVGHDVSEGVERQNGGVAAALARAGAVRVKYLNMVNIERQKKQTSDRYDCFGTRWKPPYLCDVEI